MARMEMLSLREGMQEMKKRGYTENLAFDFDHFSAQSKNIQLYPDDFAFDEIMRFENASDADDQDILYAISSEKMRIKGLYAESYGLYSVPMSPTIVAKIREYNDRRSTRKSTP